MAHSAGLTMGVFRGQSSGGLSPQIAVLATASPLPRPAPRPQTLGCVFFGGWLTEPHTKFSTFTYLHTMFLYLFFFGLIAALGVALLNSPKHTRPIAILRPPGWAVKCVETCKR